MNAYVKKAAETRNFIVDFSDKLDTEGGEILTGTPTAAEMNTSALTLSDVAVNSMERMILGRIYAPNQGVQFTVAGGTTRTDYTVRITVGTSSSPAQALIEDVRVKVL